MQAFTGERVQEARGVTDKEPAAAGPPGHPVAERPGAHDRVARAAAAPGGAVVARRRDPGHDLVRYRPPAPPRQVVLPRPPEHDPHVHASPGDRRDPDIAVTEQPHPRIAARVGIRVRQVVREADPGAEADRSGDAGGPGHDGPPPVGAHEDAGLKRRRGSVRPAHVEPAGAGIDGRDRPAEPHVRARWAREIDERGIQARAVESDGRFTACIGTVGQPEGGPGGGLDPHRGNRPRDGSQSRIVQPDPPEGGNGGR